jgi:hypothetical protein
MYMLFIKAISFLSFFQVLFLVLAVAPRISSWVGSTHHSLLLDLLLNLTLGALKTFQGGLSPL